jgi:hypothetical protein
LLGGANSWNEFGSATERVTHAPAEKPTAAARCGLTKVWRAKKTRAPDGFYTRQEYPQHLRRVGFVDPETAKQLVFLTNHFVLPALTVAALYSNAGKSSCFLSGSNSTCESAIRQCLFMCLPPS